MWKWCLNSGSGPCNESRPGTETAPALIIKAKGEFIFAGESYEWESDNCKTLNITSKSSPTKSVWTITLDGNDVLFLDTGLGAFSVLEFTRKK